MEQEVAQEVRQIQMDYQVRQRIITVHASRMPVIEERAEEEDEESSSRSWVKLGEE